MPRTPVQALAFLLGFWMVLTLVLPLGARAQTTDAELARLEHQLAEAVNRYRAEQRLIPLERRPELDAVARRHSRDMAQRRYLAHRSPEGHDWVHRLRAADVAGFALAAENVGLTTKRDPNAQVLRGWIASQVHRENLEARPFNTTGLGIVRAPDGTLYYTQLYLSFPR